MPNTTSARKVALYARVSTGDQNVQMQVEALRELASRRGWLVEGEYVDVGVSGSKDRRPELNRLLQDAKGAKFNILVVWKSDRLFRSLKHMVVTLDELAAIGVQFVSCTEPMDTSTPQGQLLLHLVSAFAQFERGIIVERTKAGIQAARRRGARLGRPRVAVDVAQARSMRAGGASLRAIAKAFGVSPGTIYSLLRGDQKSPSETAPGKAPEVADITRAA
jgi:DNA invertase Pin-like site-specific DNA recombinase